jgi:hypothetical protein
MRDYWLVKYIFSAIAWAYLIITLGAIGLALRYAKPLKSQITTTLVVVAVASILPLLGYRQHLQEQQVTDEFQVRFDKAEALFDKRCKTAGEKIYRTVENVEGVLLLNIRRSDRPGVQDNPLWADAALPNEAHDDEYIRNFLYWEHDAKAGDRGFLNSYPEGKTLAARGYRFVDVKQASGEIARYRLKQPPSPDLVKESLKRKPARYAIDFANPVNPEDRLNWVAGTTISVIDTETGEVMATRESYAFESGLGNKSGDRQPWARALTCPSWHGWDSGRTRFFVDQILKPKQG